MQSDLLALLYVLVVHIIVYLVTDTWVSSKFKYIVSRLWPAHFFDKQ